MWFKFEKPESNILASLGDSSDCKSWNFSCDTNVVAALSEALSEALIEACMDVRGTIFHH